MNDSVATHTHLLWFYVVLDSQIFALNIALSVSFSHLERKFSFHLSARPELLLKNQMLFTHIYNCNSQKLYFSAWNRLIDKTMLLIQIQQSWLVTIARPKNEYVAWLFIWYVHKRFSHTDLYVLTAILSNTCIEFVKFNVLILGVSFYKSPIASWYIVIACKH